MPEKMTLDPTAQAIIEGNRMQYQQASERPNLAPGERFHFLLMAEIHPAMLRLIYQEGLQLPFDDIYNAVILAAAKLVADLMRNAAIQDFDAPLFAEQFRANVLAIMAETGEGGTMGVTSAQQ